MVAFATNTLKAVRLIYSDGTVIEVPENLTLRVGSAFVKLIKDEQVEWKIIKTGGRSWFDKVKEFFEL